MSVMYDEGRLARLEAGLRAILPNWGLQEDSRIELLAISENATFRVGDTVFRIHRPGYHSRAEIASELAWIEALRREAIVPTLTLIPGRDGEAIGRLKEDGAPRHVVAFRFLEGREPQPGGDRLRWFHELGAISARLHAHARRWAPPPGFTRRRWDFDAMLGRVSAWGDWRCGPGLDAEGREILERTAATLRARLDAYGTGPERFGLVHADLRLANLLVADETLQVIDFDDCGFSWFVYDFAAAVSFIEHEPDLPALEQAWVAGYCDVAPLAKEDRAMIPAFVMLRRMLLTAWIASHAETPTAQALGAPYTLGTVALARRFLAGAR